MPKYFPGITHAIVRTATTKESVEKTGHLAVVYLCFTTDDDNLLVFIGKLPGPTSGVQATLPGFSIDYKGSPTFVPAIRGKAGDEIKMAALIAFDRVKQSRGIKYNKKYKVMTKDITEMEKINAERAAEVGRGSTT